jgi:hypothetical protein
LHGKKESKGVEMTLLSHPFIQDVILSLFVEVILIIIGVISAHTIIKIWNEWRYGKWTVTVIKGGEKKIEDREISSAKIKQITDMPEEKPVFLKGMCSPYHYIHDDLMKEGNPVLEWNDKKRRVVVNLDKDKSQEEQSVTKVTPGL